MLQAFQCLYDVDVGILLKVLMGFWETSKRKFRKVEIDGIFGYWLEANVPFPCSLFKIGPLCTQWSFMLWWMRLKDNAWFDTTLGREFEKLMNEFLVIEWILHATSTGAIRYVLSCLKSLIHLAVPEPNGTNFGKTWDVLELTTFVWVPRCSHHLYEFGSSTVTGTALQLSPRTRPGR